MKKLIVHTVLGEFPETIPFYPNSGRYNAEDNAKVLAKILYDYLPGDTLDVLVENIAEHMALRITLPYEIGDPQQYLENCIKTAISEIGEDN
jgi:hypothetical protein